MERDLLVEKFHKKLKRHLDFPCELIVNENRSTMLHILERKREYARLSVHRMFLDAPEEVVLAIAHYIRGSRREKEERDRRIRSYIQSNLPRFDYSDRLDVSKLETQGRFYDIKEIFDELNCRYFQSALSLALTWFGDSCRPTKRSFRIVFGQYFDHLKLIKVHRLLDDPFFPRYFVEYVLYHEMLHHVVRGFVGENGRYRVHGPDFKRRERLFIDYERAIKWEEEHKEALFTRKRK